MKKFSEIKELVAALESDVEKFSKSNNKAAGTRVRKGLQDLKTLSQALRLEIQDMKNAEVKE